MKHGCSTFHVPRSILEHGWSTFHPCPILDAAWIHSRSISPAPGIPPAGIHWVSQCLPLPPGHRLQAGPGQGEASPAVRWGRLPRPGACPEDAGQRRQPPANRAGADGGVARWTVTPPIQARVRLWRTAAPGGSLMDSARVIFFVSENPSKWRVCLWWTPSSSGKECPFACSGPLLLSGGLQKMDLSFWS